MPSEDTKILGFNQNQKHGKTPFIIYEDLQCIIERTDWCKNNPENSSATKVTKIIHQIVQCLQYLHLEIQKISKKVVKIVWKRFVNS